MAGGITIALVETLDRSGQGATSFFPFTDPLILRVTYGLSDDLRSLPDLELKITFTIIAAQSNQGVASQMLKTGVATDFDYNYFAWTEPAKTPDVWGFSTQQGDVFGARVIIVLDSARAQLDEFAVSEITWFRLKKEYKA